MRTGKDASAKKIEEVLDVGIHIAQTGGEEESRGLPFLSIMVPATMLDPSTCNPLLVVDPTIPTPVNPAILFQDPFDPSDVVPTGTGPL